MAKIIVSGNDQRREYDLAPVNTIGRHPDNTLQILDRIVSKEHAQVLRQPDGRYLFRDLGSLNGSFLHGERVHEHILREGDEIMLGSTSLTFQEKSAQDSLLQKVTIAPSVTEALIRQKIQAPSPSTEFLPEREIFDVEVLRRDYEKLRLANELGRSIGLEVNLDILLEQIIMKAFELIPADRGVILLLEDGVPQPKIAKTRDGKNEQIVLSKSILAEVVTNKASVLSSDATMDSRFSAAHSVIMQGIRSTMTVPLLHRDELLGIMHLDSMIATNAFTEKDLQIFGGIASQAAVAIHNSELARKIEHEAKTRAQFQRLLSPNLVDQVVQGKLQLEKGGALSEITMLFSDIRGFTSMSESREPQEIVRMLNEYFELMVDVIFKYEGTLDKFVGDEVIALFGAPVAMQNAEFKAVQCALDMMRVLSEWNRTRAAEGQNEINIGIGINTGIVVTGAIGSSRALQYTAIGDAVNTASRLCNIAQAGQVILSEATYRKVQDVVAAVPLPPVRVKGKADELRVYNAVGLRDRDYRGENTRPGLTQATRRERSCGRSSVCSASSSPSGRRARARSSCCRRPAKTLALAAIVASERSAFIVAAAVVALGIALVLRGVGSPFIASVIALLVGLGHRARPHPAGAGAAARAGARRAARPQALPPRADRHRGARAPRSDRPLRHRRRRPRAVARRLPAGAPAGDAEPPAAGGPRRILGGGPARRSIAHQPGAGRAWVHRVRRGVSARAAAQLADRARRREVRHRLGQAARDDRRLERRSEEGHAARPLRGRAPGADGGLHGDGGRSPLELPVRRPAGGAVVDSSVESVISLYGPTDLAWAYAHPANLHAADSPEKLRAFLGDAPEREPERYRAMSPTERVTATAPRTLLVQGGRDQFVAPDQMDRLAARLAAARRRRTRRSSSPTPSTPSTSSPAASPARSSRRRCSRSCGPLTEWRALRRARAPRRRPARGGARPDAAPS